MHGNYSLLRSAGLDPPIGIYSFILVRYIDYIPTTSVSVIDTVIYLHFFPLIHQQYLIWFSFSPVGDSTCPLWFNTVISITITLYGKTPIYSKIIK